MTNFTISLAETAIEVNAVYPSTKDFCRDYLTDEEPLFSVTVDEKVIRAERERVASAGRVDPDLTLLSGKGDSSRTISSGRADSSRTISSGRADSSRTISSGRADSSRTISSGRANPTPNYSDAYLETLALQRAVAVHLLDYGVIVFHGAVVSADGKAYLFTAPSGTGKTTHTNLWVENIPGVYILNGDKPFLKITSNGVLACGAPWQGKEKRGRNEILPLAGLCELQRDSSNHIEEISPEEAFVTLLRQTNRPAEADPMRKTLELVSRLAGSVRLYRLGCNMDPEAARVSYERMVLCRE